MSAPEDLVSAVLAEYCRSERQASSILVAARDIDVDPLDYCLQRFDIDAELLYERAARWAGLAFWATLPNVARCDPGAIDLDALRFRPRVDALLLDRQVSFVSPSFDQMLALREIAAGAARRRTICIVPPAALRASLVRHAAPQLTEAATQRLARRWPGATAAEEMRRARMGFLAGGAVLAALAMAAPLLQQPLLVALVTLIFIGPALLRLGALVHEAAARRSSRASSPSPLSDARLPIYSVLIPLCDEARMVPLLYRAMTALDYPAEKLEVKFVVEARSTQTIDAIERLPADPRFELIVVPTAPPYTKPKALNYALPLVRGEHLVVYDAEDIPDPDQLRLAATGFAADPAVECLQAELLVDNARENLVTGLFTGEYAGQFGILMRAFADWRLPMPLGGTSNHFRTATLRAIGGWDAFNVTEDADLGLRLARRRLPTGMLASQTYEEAPVTLDVWMRQRTRWMKGWMQTFIVHNRHPRRLLADLGWRNLLVFELHVGSLILSPLLHTAFVLAIAAELATGGAPFDVTDPTTSFEMLSLLLGYGSTFALVLLGLRRLGQRRLFAMQMLLPLYWVLHTVATCRAGAQLLTRPHYWGKTEHGMTRLERTFAAAAATRPRPLGMAEMLGGFRRKWPG